MSDKSRLSQTMRIDIHPDMLDTPIASKKTVPPVRVYEADDTEYVTVQDAERTSDSEFSKLLQGIYDGVLIAEMSGRIVDYNSRAAALFMMGGRSLKGSNIVDLISGADKSLLSTIRQNLSDSRHTIIDASCVRNDLIFPAEIAANSIELQGRTRMCFFIRDVTVRKQAQQALEDAIKRLEEHDVAKTQFVSNVSHELRTPLTSMIYAVTNMLKGVVGPLPDRVRQYLEMMDGDCKRLLGTVNDILDLRKIESNTLTLNKAHFSFVDLVKRAAGSLRVQSDRKSIKLSVDDGGGRWFVNCDPQKVERAIINIVGNAVKFTPNEGEIEVFLEDDPDNKGYVRCSVRDSGVGISPQWIDHVTERYVTVGDQATGTGLGLALTKEIVELHGGGIGIASPPPGFDKGTVVSIILPVDESPQILIVDDEPLISNLLEAQIAGRGYRVLKAGNGVEALERMASDKPGLAIVDLVMPEMGGAELIMKMKSSKATMKIPVIVMTGGNLESTQTEVLESFAIPALSKPWDEEDLLRRIAEAFIGAATLSKK